MTATAKFMFDTDFTPGRPDAAPKIDLAAHEAEVSAAEQRGYRTGMNAAEAQARTEAERRMAMALENIGNSLDRLIGTIAAVEKKLEIEAVEVAAACARKLASELIAREPMTEIAALAAGCLGELRSAPHVVVRVHESLLEQTREKLTAIAASRGFEGRLVVLGETEIVPGDCRLEWADGGMIRDQEATSKLITEAVARYVSARSSPAA
jgi:flagellar assembly protein FliH